MKRANGHASVDVDSNRVHEHVMSSYFSNWHFAPAVFTASDVDRMANVRPAAQRDWRRRGLLPAPDGWARYTPADVAQIAVRQVLGSLGLPHLSELLVLDEVVSAVLDWAATYPGAVDYRATGEVGGPPSQPSLRFCLALPNRLSADELEFLIFQSGSDLELWHDAQSGLGSCLHIVDCKRLGTTLAQRANCPLWKVVEGPSSDEVAVALNSAGRGDPVAQAALNSIGLDWRVPGE